MWYLVSLSINQFVKITYEDGEVNFNFKGKELQKPVFEVRESNQITTTEIDDDSFASDFGDYISSISKMLNSKVVLLNFNTFLVKWKDSPADLKEIVDSVLTKNSKAIIAPISNFQTSNYSYQDNLVFEYIRKS